MIITLRGYQQFFKNRFFELIKSGMRNICIGLQTGGGKTYLSASIAEEYINRGEVVIFIAPRINLVYQTIKSFIHLGRVQVIQGDKKFDNDGLIYIASMQTLVRRNLPFKPSLIIHDERHSGFSGKTHKKIMNKFSDAHYLSLTATPFDSKGWPLKGFDEVIKYNDIQWYIDNKYLVDCDCYAPVLPDLSKVKMTAGDYNEKDLDIVMNNSVMIGNIVEETKDMIKGKKTLFFSVTIAHAENVAKQYRDVGFKSKAYHSKLSNDVRSEMINDFESGEIDILVSVSALVMGFDVPSVNCLIIARPTKSQSFYRQLIGRGMRPFENKELCLLLDCAGVVKENGLPCDEVIPKVVKKKLKKVIDCNICGLKASPISKSLKRVNGILNYVTKWSCNSGHTFETMKEAGVTICGNCTKIIPPGNAEFREDDDEYIVYAKCECGYEVPIRTIPKIKKKLTKIEKSRVSKLDLLRKIINITNDNQKELIQKLNKYILEITHQDMHEQCLSSIYVSLDMGLPDEEIKQSLKNTVISSALEHNKFDCLNTEMLRTAYNQAKDPANIIHMHNSRSILPMADNFLTKTIKRLREFEMVYPDSKPWLMDAIKTRCKNINSKGNKMASLYYFFDYLTEKEVEKTIENIS